VVEPAGAEGTAVGAPLVAAALGGELALAGADGKSADDEPPVVPLTAPRPDVVLPHAAAARAVATTTQIERSFTGASMTRGRGAVEAAAPNRAQITSCVPGWTRVRAAPRP
jgi:hypothetical protein